MKKYKKIGGCWPYPYCAEYLIHLLATEARVRRGMEQSGDSFVYFALIIFMGLVVFAGVIVVSKFGASIKNIQNQTEESWSRESKAEQDRITMEKNRAAGAV
jgi:hypothetical protein